MVSLMPGAGRSELVRKAAGRLRQDAAVRVHHPGPDLPDCQRWRRVEHWLVIARRTYGTTGLDESDDATRRRGWCEMGIVGGRIGYEVLRYVAPGGGRSKLDGSAYANRSKLEVLLGASFWETIRGRSVIDFGCGAGSDAIEMATHGASRVVGVDIQERLLERAREAARLAGVDAICTFERMASTTCDVIVSLDSFEHFARPDDVLRVMHGLLAPGGTVVASFGPTWHHPLGGHLFSVFPWAHLVFTERALLRWRSEFKDDGATRFGEVAGGLNQMTIARFERIVASSPLRLASLELVPIRRMRRLHNRITREFTTAIVRCRLVAR